MGLSIATLLSQHHEVMAVDIVPEKVEKINNKISPIQDEYIEQYLAEKDLNLTATLDAEAAYAVLHVCSFVVGIMIFPAVTVFTNITTVWSIARAGKKSNVCAIVTFVEKYRNV